jgi:hypothetical protein
MGRFSSLIYAKELILPHPYSCILEPEVYVQSIPLACNWCWWGRGMLLPELFNDVYRGSGIKMKKWNLVAVHVERARARAWYMQRMSYHAARGIHIGRPQRFALFWSLPFVRSCPNLLTPLPPRTSASRNFFPLLILSIIIPHLLYNCKCIIILIGT